MVISKAIPADAMAVTVGWAASGYTALFPHLLCVLRTCFASIAREAIAGLPAANTVARAVLWAFGLNLAAFSFVARHTVAATGFAGAFSIAVAWNIFLARITLEARGAHALS